MVTSQETQNYKFKKIDKNTDKILDSIDYLNENFDDIDGLIKNTEELFIATFGATTFSQIQTAVNEEKIILLDYGGTHRLQLTYISTEQFNFAGFVDASNTLFNAVCKSTNEWVLESNDSSNFATKDKYGDTTINVGRKADSTVGNYSTALGTNSTASGIGSIAGGSNSSATGGYAVALGSGARASGYASSSFGNNTIASINGQVAEGAYNVADEESAYILGNGTSGTDRSNAHTVHKNGTAWFQGDVYVGSTSGKNKDDGSKKLATEEYVNQHSGGASNILTFTNVTVLTTAWGEDTTYEEFGYKADIVCAGVTADFFSDVVFDVAEATSGNYAPISVTGTGIVTIYAVELPSANITIPTIICSKGA